MPNARAKDHKHPHPALVATVAGGVGLAAGCYVALRYVADACML